DNPRPPAATGRLREELEPVVSASGLRRCASDRVPLLPGMLPSVRGQRTPRRARGQASALSLYWTSPTWTASLWQMPNAVEVAAARLTTTEAAVLALLAMEGERSGYDLSKLVEKSIAHVWGPARSGLYAVLPRLERAGLATHRVATQATRPDKRLYTITDQGREALDAWLEAVEPGATDNFFLKLFVGGLTSDDILLEQVAQFRTDT